MAYRKESEVQKDIFNYLASLNIWAWRNANGPLLVRGRMFPNKTPGSPDILGVLPCGRSLQIEVKAHPKATKSNHQIAWIERAKLNGAMAFFAHSVECVNKQLLFCNKDCTADMTCLGVLNRDVV